MREEERRKEGRKQGEKGGREEGKGGGKKGKRKENYMPRRQLKINKKNLILDHFLLLFSSICVSGCSFIDSSRFKSIP